MPVFLEFLVVAALIYLWESTLWLPKRGHALRRIWLAKSWRVSSATRLLSTRELGVIPMLPLPPDASLIPCPGFPLALDDTGAIFIDDADGFFRKTEARTWEDIRFTAPHLHAGNLSVRCQSPAAMDSLREARSLGIEPQAAIRNCAAQSVSPSRAKRDQKRWKIVSAPLRFYSPVLTLGFFGGIPATYLFLGSAYALWLAAWLWCIMWAISLHLFWIAKHAYPSCRNEIRQDAWFSLLVPFHAMRALEITSVHVFARTHPAAILFASGELTHPWLASFIRNILFPRPTYRGDAALASTLLPEIEKILNRKKRKASDFDTPPDHSDDPDAYSYCPRCHRMFLKGKEVCSDCGGIPLRLF
jgi:hypothetical protein